MKYRLLRSVFELKSTKLGISYDDIDRLIGKDLFDKIKDDARDTFDSSHQTPYLRRNDYCNLSLTNDTFLIDVHFEYIQDSDSGDEYLYNASLFIELDSNLEYIKFEVVTEN